MRGAGELRIANLVEPTPGQSSETVLFDAIWRENGRRREHGLVVRVQGHMIRPMLADVMIQHDVIKAIASHSNAAVPTIAFVEPGGKALGQPFFLTERRDGRVPSRFRRTEPKDGSPTCPCPRAPGCGGMQLPR